MKDACNNERETERGIALITTLLSTTILLALGMAVVLSATTDTVTTKVQRVGEQSFFVADAGVGIARQALTQALTDELQAVKASIVAGTWPYYYNVPTTPGEPPNVQVLPPPLPNHPWNQQPDFYQRVKARADALLTSQPRDQRFRNLNGGSFTVDFKPLTGRVKVNPWFANTTQEVIEFHYAIQVTGTTDAGGSATVNEVGKLTANINLQYGPPSGGNRDFSFSGFGAFFDVGDDPNHLNYVLVPGTFSGPVHTNSHFGFYTGWQYTFRDAISQVDDNFRVYYNTFVPVANVANYSGSIHLSAAGYKKTGRVPLPTNEFSQEYAVINGTGITDRTSGGMPVDPPAVVTTDGNGNPNIFDSSGRVTAIALAANLRTAANVAPTISSGALVNGVYISSSNGTSIDGAGIYVQGDASDIQLYADPNGTQLDQVYVIQQGTTITTIRTNFVSNTTTISSGSSTTTYTGVPTDKSDPLHTRAGVSLFVNGGVTSLHGGVDSSHLTRPAIASKTALTITAQRSIKVTGDLKYADPVVNPDGTPTSNIADVKNVLGLFTNDGNIYLDAKTAYSSNSDLSIEIDAANCVFDTNTSNNSEAPYTGQEGGITTWFGAGHQTPTSNARIKLVGSDVEKNNSLVDYYNGDTFFDIRFSGGGFRPPFFPGTTYALGPPPVAEVLTSPSITETQSAAKSWFRDNN